VVVGVGKEREREGMVNAPSCSSLVFRFVEKYQRLHYRFYSDIASKSNKNPTNCVSSEPIFEYWTPPPNLKYPVRAVDPSTVTPSGWVPPQGGYENLPFRFYRSSAGKNLPVYLERKRKTITAVRRFRGDKEVKYKCNIVTVSDDGEKAIAEELAKVCPGAEVYHCAGSVVVVGDHRAAIQAWLLGLGF